MLLVVDEELVRRARLHAALGEPARLAVVDLLSLGDASPRELGAALGLGSNLLSHHLNVLQDAGLVVRTPSEADRRRTYVGLALGDPLVTGVLPVAPQRAVPRVVFVCTRNSARSHLARAAFERTSRVPTTSAGTRPAARVDPVAAAVGARHGLDLSGRATAHVDAVLRPGDLVVAVCDDAHERGLGPRPGPALHWSVPDPVRVGTEAAFEAAVAQLIVRADRLGRALTPARSTA